jgi:hypothetical protein
MIEHRMREPGGAQARHHLAALVCLGLGFWLAYVVWSRQPGLRVPPAVGYLAAGSFGAAGISLFLQGAGFARAAAVPAILAATALAGIGGWIGFGPGGRRCEGSIGIIPFIPGEWVCRLVFGAGAILTALIVLLMLHSLFRTDESP